MNVMNIFYLKHFCMEIADDKSQQPKTYYVQFEFYNVFA